MTAIKASLQSPGGMLSSSKNLIPWVMPRGTPQISICFGKLNYISPRITPIYDSENNPSWAFKNSTFGITRFRQLIMSVSWHEKKDGMFPCINNQCLFIVQGRITCKCNSTQLYWLPFKSPGCIYRRACLEQWRFLEETWKEFLERWLKWTGNTQAGFMSEREPARCSDGLNGVTEQGQGEIQGWILRLLLILGHWSTIWWKLGAAQIDWAEISRFNVRHVKVKML